jgi:hypothetical protein
MTKRELISLLEDYPDDISISVGPPDGEAGTDNELLDLMYVSGGGRAQPDGRAIILTYRADYPDTADECEDLSCPSCGHPITECPKCKEAL